MSLALVFSPQGSQAVGMGRELAVASPAAGDVWAEADATLGWPVSDVSWNGPAAALNDTRQTQPCMLAASIACMRALEERLGAAVETACVAGHSVGEYAALVAAGVVSLADGLRLVARRAQLMAAVDVDGGMAAIIGLDRDAIASAIAAVASPDEIVVANDNAPGQVVISGMRKAMAAAEVRLRAAGARRVIALRVSGPFHSPAMRGVSAALAEAFAEISWRDADPPLISNVTAEPVRDAATIRTLLAEQVAAPVEWVASVRRMVDDGVDTFVECGPGSALTGMVKRIAGQVRTLNVADSASLAATVAVLAPARSPV